MPRKVQGNWRKFKKSILGIEKCRESAEKQRETQKIYFKANKSAGKLEGNLKNQL